MNIQHSHLHFATLFTLAWRNLWRHRRRTVITLSSIALGFGMAVFFIGVGDGGHNSMIRNAIKLGEGHITLQARGYLESPANHKYLAHSRDLIAAIEQLNIPGKVKPRISLQVLASTANNSVGAGLEAISSDNDPRVEMLEPMLIKGRWPKAGDRQGIVIGDGMAKKLKAKVGSKVVLMTGTQSGDTQAHLGRVRGIFDSRVDDLDDFLILSHIELGLQFLIGEGADKNAQSVTRLSVFLDDPDKLVVWKNTLKDNFDSQDLVVLDWQEMMPQLVQFIVLDDAGNYVFLILILIMVVFGIVNTVLMSVLERTREFGLLRALGLGRRHLLTLVFTESVLLSFLAVIFGWLVGGGIHLWFSYHGINIGELVGDGTAIMGTFMDSVIYTELSWDRVTQLTTIVFVATLTSGIYPALKAANVTPVEALRT